MTWFSQRNEIDELIARGDIDVALQRFHSLRQHPHTTPADLVRYRQSLTQAFLSRAVAAMGTENFLDAWHEIGRASELATGTDSDTVATKTSQLIELTVEHAEVLLFSGKSKRAIQLVQEIRDRDIQDCRVDRIVQISHCIDEADQLSSRGKFNQAIEKIEMLLEVEPEFDAITNRIKSMQRRNKRLAELSDELQAAALACQWIEVSEVCDRILLLAPHHDIAVEAKKHALQKMKRQTNPGPRLTNVPEPSPSFFEVKSLSSQTNRETKTTSDPVESTELPPESFMAWVDGVGGFLICTAPVCFVGQATDDSTVAIPLQGDLRLRHARIELSNGHHLVQPLGAITLNDEEFDETFVLQDGNVLGLGNDVRLKYSKTHPLSSTSKLDFVSRHRTRPWSDAVLLAGNSVILGPRQHNHIFCPRWSEDLMLFHRNNQWFCRRQNKPFVIDQVRHEGEAPIQFSSRIEGDDFSLSLEPMKRVVASSEDS